MKKRRILLALLCLLGMAGTAQAVTFQATDEPGSWFDCSGTPQDTCVPYGKGKSLALVPKGGTVTFSSKAGKINTVHTAVSLLYPSTAGSVTGDHSMPVDNDLTVGGPDQTFTLTQPGLYVFFCDIHVYMFAAVIVPDGNTLDLGKTVDLHNVVLENLPIPTASDLALRLLRTFFIVTNPNNWQDHTQVGWTPSYPAVPVVAYDQNGTKVATADLGAYGIQTLNDLLQAYFPPTTTFPSNHLTPPSHKGVGEVWVDTQLEKMAEKTKPGTATAVDAGSWKVTKKFGLPHIGNVHHGKHDGMNNPHNMWTDKNQTVIYQTQWFDENLAVFDRKHGTPMGNIKVGAAPAHVMTRTYDDYVHVSLNGGNDVIELLPGVLTPSQHSPIAMGNTGKDVHPHAHWMSADGHMMVTPNEDADTSTLFNFRDYSIASTTDVGHSPLATGMMPDSSKYYVANFLDQNISVIGIHGAKSHHPTAYPMTTINLIANYSNFKSLSEPFAGILGLPPTAITGPVGGLPIQTPVSPDGKYVLTANTLTATITIIDTYKDLMVKSLACDPGCHGVQFGAKQGGGYYAYVSSKFSNRLIVIDLYPGKTDVCIGTNDGLPCVVGYVGLTTANAGSHGITTDGTVTENEGMGGQGVLPIPLVYNGWVQNLPEEWSEKLTYQQRHPIGQ